MTPANTGRNLRTVTWLRLLSNVTYETAKTAAWKFSLKKIKLLLAIEIFRSSIRLQPNRITLMNSFLAQQTRDIAAGQILAALENGDAIETARGLRDEIIAGWKAAMEKSGCPAEVIEMLALK